MKRTMLFQHEDGGLVEIQSVFSFDGCCPLPSSSLNWAESGANKIVLVTGGDIGCLGAMAWDPRAGLVLVGEMGKA